MEFKKGNKPETRMLHQLIELAKAGKKFMARRPDSACTIGFSNEHFGQCNGWSSNDAIAHWQYEEIKEPRVVEFECEWRLTPERGLYPITQDNTINNLYEKLKNGKFKVVCTEVIDE